MSRVVLQLSTAAIGAALIAAVIGLSSGWRVDRVPDTGTRRDAAGTAVTDDVGVTAQALEVDAGGLDPGLVAALDQARVAAEADGVQLPVASGHRSAREQADLLEREIAERGDVDEALTWVFPPEHSLHVRGLAIDVYNGPGADWLDQHGDRFGLCRTLAWEWWHFEWREAWQRDGSCPAPANDLSEVPTP